MLSGLLSLALLDYNEETNNINIRNVLKFNLCMQCKEVHMFWRKIYGHDWPPCIDKLQQNKINGTMDKLGQTTSYCNGLNDDVENWSLSQAVYSLF